MASEPADRKSNGMTASAKIAGAVIAGRLLQILNYDSVFFLPLSLILASPPGDKPLPGVIATPIRSGQAAVYPAGSEVSTATSARRHYA